MKTIEKRIKYDFHNNKIECPLWSHLDFKIDIEDRYPIQTALAYKFNNDLENGFYVEIGAGHYKEENHTYFLEKKYNWKGVSIDNSKHVVDDFNKNRNNVCLYGDALTFNWKSYFEENNVPKVIDYLSVDVDFEPNPWANLLAFLNLPVNEYRFNVISIEHGAAFKYELERLKSIQREILNNLGYFLIIRGECEDLWHRETPTSTNGLDQISTDWKFRGLGL